MNFYFNADSYWKFKFRDTNLSAETWQEAPLNNLQLFWGSHISIVSMSPNFLLLLVNVLVGHKLPIRPRIVVPLILNLFLFILSALFTKVDTDSWQVGFYSLTLGFALLFNMSDSVFQGAFSSVIGRFPSRYMGGMMQGQAFGGVLSSGCSVLLLVTGLDQTNVALVYFLIASVYLLLSLLLYLWISRHPFYRQYADQRITPGEKSEISGDKANIKEVSLKVWLPALTVLLVYLVTLGIYPSLPALADTKTSNSTWKRYYRPVGVFLLYNCLDLVGRTLATLFPPIPNKVALLLAIARIGFIPLFLMCNLAPENRSVTDVLFPSDAAFLTIHALFSVSSGFLTNTAMIAGPKQVPQNRSFRLMTALDQVEGEEEKTLAASILVFSLVFGLFLGAASSYLWVRLL